MLSAHKVRGRLLLVGAVAWILLGLAGCHRPPAEQAIRDTIAAMQAAGEKHDISGVIAPMADDFGGRDADAELNVDRKAFQRYLTLVQMQEGGSLHATLGPITIAMQGPITPLPISRCW